MMNPRKGGSRDYSIERRREIFRVVKENENTMSYADISRKLLDMNYGNLITCRRSKWFKEMESQEQVA